MQQQTPKRTRNQYSRLATNASGVWCALGPRNSPTTCGFGVPSVEIRRPGARTIAISRGGTNTSVTESMRNVAGNARSAAISPGTENRPPPWSDPHKVRTGETLLELFSMRVIQCASKYTPTHTSAAAAHRRRSTFSLRKILPAMAFVTRVSEAAAGPTRLRFR